jgi:hypothetical protein
VRDLQASGNDCRRHHHWQVLCYFFSIEMPPGEAEAEQEAV